MVEQLRATTGDPVDQVLAALAERATQREGPSAHRTGAPSMAAVRVLDVGGGSGTRAVPLASLGCSVVVVDSSVNALAILHRRAEDAGVADRVVGRQADADRLDTVVEPDSADLVVCHHLLEEVDDPATVMRGLAGAVRPGGSVSILVAGRLGAVLAQTLAGRFDEARELLNRADARSGPGDPLRRRFDVLGVRTLVESVGLVVEAVTGVGVLADLVPAAARRAGPGAESELAELEAAAAGHPDLLPVAADLHLVARRADPTGWPIGAA
ncbi:MAG TPA: methyltransferase domain-containing protein [Nakamurella sp.]